MPKDASQASGSHSLNDDDLEKMVSDAVFYCLVKDQKKDAIKVIYQLKSGSNIYFFSLERRFV